MKKLVAFVLALALMLLACAPALAYNSDLDIWIDGYHIMVSKAYDDCEYLTVLCEDSYGDIAWMYEDFTNSVTELDQLTAFINNAPNGTMVMCYNSEQGKLTALDYRTGYELWSTWVYLGASISCDSDSYGNMYIGGYYGPDPVCIDQYGNVKWYSNSGGCYGLYSVMVDWDEVYCWYESINDTGYSGRVTFDTSGRRIDVMYD